MAVMPMKQIEIFGLLKDRKSVLEKLQRSSVVEISCIEHADDDDVFYKTDMSSECSQFNKFSEAAGSALKILGNLIPDGNIGPSAIKGREELSVSQYENYINDVEETDGIIKDIIDEDKKISELKAEIPKLLLQREALMPWKALDVPLDLAGTKTTDIITGTVGGDIKLEDILNKVHEEKKDLELFDVNVISESPEQTCLMFVVKKEYTSDLEDVLRLVGFAKAPLSKRNPAEEIEALDGKVSSYKEEIKSREEKILSFENKIDLIKFTEDYYKMRADKYSVISKLSGSKRTFRIKGYVPSEYLGRLEENLNEYDVTLEVSAPAEDAPILLKNNAYVSPVEGIVEGYSMPNSKEIDPSAIMATFYYVFYGMMLSDAAYGLIITFSCAHFLKKFKNMEEGMKKFLKMFFYCGISTTVWGILYGSFFGDLIPVLGKTFFGMTEAQAANIPLLGENCHILDAMKNTMSILGLAFIFGIIHLFVGLGIKFYNEWKTVSLKDAIYDVVFWYMFVGGGILYLLSTDMVAGMFGIEKLGAQAASVAGWVTALGALGVTLTSGRASKNPVIRIVLGLYDVYGVTGYLSDILSYSRLMALGLATGVISSVFNMMGSMPAQNGNKVIGLLVFILVFAIGHTMNIAVNALGAYVHCNRLQYVEFFGKFYEGGGRKLDPFTENTKYYRTVNK